MNKKKYIIPVLLIVLLLGGAGLISNEYYHRTYDSKKPQIFEIEDTASRGAYLVGFQETRYYMIQDCPDNEGDLKELIKNFCSKNEFSDLIDPSNNINSVDISFMKPSWALPVCWNIEWASMHFQDARADAAPMSDFFDTNLVAYVSYTYDSYSGYEEDMVFLPENL